MTPVDCHEFHDRAPELALGLLAGDDRGAAIDHVARCASCRAHLDGLVRVADNLLLMPPAIEPEIGFESRVMARLAAEGAFKESAPAPDGQKLARPRPRLRWSRPLLAGAAAAMILAAAVIGVAAGRDRGRADLSRTQATAVNALAARSVVVTAAGGRATCRLVAFPRQGNQAAWLVIHLDEPDEPPGVSSSYQVLAEPTGGGPAVMVGTIPIDDGQGTLTVSIPPRTGPVNAVRIIDSPDIVRYRATFASI